MIAKGRDIALPYTDTDPHRRNLVIISMSYLLFAIGGGHIEKGAAIKLPMINVYFDNPTALPWFAWIMLCWFGYRYWQKCPSALEELKNDLLRLAHTDTDTELTKIAKSSRTDKGGWPRDVIPFVNPWDMLFSEKSKIPVHFHKERVAPFDNGVPRLTKTDFYLIIEPEKLKEIRGRLFQTALIKKSALADWLLPWVMLFAAQFSAFYIGTDRGVDLVIWIWTINEALFS